MELITIYMPTRNRRSLVQRAVESVLEQTYPNFELIVVDDGSVDGTVEYLAEVASKDERVKFLVNESSLGACASRNRAILAARGRFVTGLDDDDFFMPTHLEVLKKAYDALSAQGQPAAVFPRTITRTVSGDRVRRHQLPVVRHIDLLRSNWVGNQVFAERDTYVSSGMFDVQMPAWQDYDLWVRLASLVGVLHRVDQATYLQDESHDLSRTTAKQAFLIREAFLRFASKHLSVKDRRSYFVLRVNYHSYPQVPLSTTELMEYFFHGIYVKPLLQYIRKRIGRA